MTYGASPTEVNELLLQAAPAQGQWTEQDYLWLTDHTSRLVELTDGYLEVLPLPTEQHQLVLLAVYRLLLTCLPGAHILIAPFRLQVRPDKFREPDLLLLLDPQDPRRNNRFWTGADLVMEVLSPDRPERDLIEKRQDYGEAGVQEYWILDPATATLRGLTLTGTTYQELPGNRSALISELVLQPAQIFQAP